MKSIVAITIWLALINSIDHVQVFASATTGKILNFGPKLAEYIEQHPDKSWLIKFYVPWCYHCQQIGELNCETLSID